MKISMESTNIIITLDGVAVRLWNGTDEYGVPCKVFVHRVGVALPRDLAHFESDLKVMDPPDEVRNPRVLELRQLL
jgi:hypothetical protein